MNRIPEPPEVIRVESRVVACDGGEGAVGHPRVFLNMGDEGRVECPYCDRLFILKGGPADTAADEAA
ncbi:MAG: hypothetical protein KatS3mg119_0814 [Rhodothalassiaceae bacterium]|nr:MAG: hypothetical protein KatS3mg119_0814 [Rhodothalassiaceae bacterium]